MKGGDFYYCPGGTLGKYKCYLDIGTTTPSAAACSFLQVVMLSVFPSVLTQGVQTAEPCVYEGSVSHAVFRVHRLV